jgi:hypothetical protein
MDGWYYYGLSGQYGGRKTRPLDAVSSPNHDRDYSFTSDSSEEISGRGTRGDESFYDYVWIRSSWHSDSSEASATLERWQDS